MIKNYPKLQFIKNFNKEILFIENKFEEAEKFIGQKKFAYIINHNIPDCYHKNKKIFYKNLRQYIKTNKNIITSNIQNKSIILEKRWKKFEKNFFKQMEEIAHLKWKYKNYKSYLLYSCFWGGDYDINKQNVYINPLLKHGDPLYVLFHELSHLLYWEYIFKKYPKNFIKKNYNFLWRLSEIMVNYPLLKIKINFKFPLIIPKNLEKFSKKILKNFPTKNFTEIIKNELKKRAG